MKPLHLLGIAAIAAALAISNAFAASPPAEFDTEAGLPPAPAGEAHVATKSGAAAGLVDPDA